MADEELKKQIQMSDQTKPGLSEPRPRHRTRSGSWTISGLRWDRTTETSSAWITTDDLDHDHTLDLLEDLQGLHAEDHRILDLDSALGLKEDLDLDWSRPKPSRRRVQTRIQRPDPGPDLGPAPGPAPHPGPSPWVSSLWDELKSLRRLVLVLKGRDSDRSQTVRTLETRLRDLSLQSETRARTVDRDLRENQENLRENQENLRENLRKTNEKLNQTQSRSEDLQRSQASVSELSFLQTRLRAAEGAVEELKRKSSVFASKLCLAESQLQQLQKVSSECNTSSSSESGSDKLDPPSLQTQESVSELQVALNSSLSQVQDLRLRVKDVSDELERLKSSAAEVNELKTEMFELKNRAQVWTRG
ncbi:hypothetical protein WMY93_033367 [Mugilogobius chulae]|uniref:Uncharacterized protein n=1 Tax=Mugilogobius chulae TaxID=88201 RepID=A0AAW0MLF1_9GOBI